MKEIEHYRENLHAFSITYLGATDHLPTRFSIESLLFGTHKTYSFNSDYRTIVDQAIAILEQMNYPIKCRASFGWKTIILSTNFEKPEFKK